MKSRAELPIGVFDSGVGGLTVVRQIHRLMPKEDVVYLGDTARVPYGTKSPSTVTRFACEDADFLERQGVKAIVVACNTASAWALPTLEREFSLPVLGVIIPGVEAALAKTRNNRIGVIGTSATIRSLAYTRAIMERNNMAKVFERACPLLVPLVEEGLMRHVVTIQILRDYVRPLLRSKIDTLVLGCTHYPVIKTVIRSVTGKAVKLVDSAESCARFVLRRLEQLDLLSRSRLRAGRIHPFVTDETDRFDELASRFLGDDTEPARRVDLIPRPLNLNPAVGI